MDNRQPLPPLSWEDEAAGSARWWLARAREIVPDGRIDYFIAEDDLTATFVAVALLPRARGYTVVGAAPFGAGTAGSAVMAAKAAAAAWRARARNPGGYRRWPVFRWRLARFGGLVARDLLLAGAGFAGGGALGLGLAYLAASSGLNGWPLALTGLVLGAGAGPVLKLLVDRNVGVPHPRPWARLAVLAASALTGAVAAAGAALTLYWS